MQPEATLRGGQMEPLAPSGEVGWIFCLSLRGGLKKNDPAAPALARTSRRPRREGTSLFPAKREAKREATKAWQAWPGNQTSSRCLVRSLVRRRGATAARASKSGPPLKRNGILHGSLLAPFSPF